MVVRAEDGWKLFFEYAREDASCVGLAESERPLGPWSCREVLLAPRSERWDSWRLSTGPIIAAGGDRPVMFYGASRDAHWRIGWAAFKAFNIVDCGAEPLVTPCDLQEGWIDIAFASSAVAEEGEVWLHRSIADQDLQRATLRVVDEEASPRARMAARAA